MQIKRKKERKKEVCRVQYSNSAATFEFYRKILKSKDSSNNAGFLRSQFLPGDGEH